MRRADRLFQIVQILRSRRLTTAAQLAGELQVSLRTVYRDVADLGASGVPVLGEAGVGYAMRQGFEMPPLAFNGDEIEALAMGARMVRSWADAELSRSASSALSKIEALLPEALRERLQSESFAAPRGPWQDGFTAILKPLRDACRQKKKLRFSYTDREGQGTERSVRPLVLLFWGQTWTLGAWCEHRQDFRMFRVDRIGELKTLGPFKDEPGKTMKDYFKLQEARRIAQGESIVRG